MTAQWTSAFPLSSLPAGGRRVARVAGRKIAIFRPTPNELYAVDNLCPHEGYPLVQGKLADDCVLTCAWHNFKFDVRDGHCIYGEESVRSYPVRIAGEGVEIDLAEPDPETQIPALVESLTRGLHSDRMGQVARDAARLLQLGVAPAEILAHAACFDAERSTQGLGHTVAVAADVLDLLPRFPGGDAVLPIMQALELASEDSARWRRRNLQDPGTPPEDPAEFSQRLFDLVESESWSDAEALFRGALAAGWKRAAIEPALLRLCTAHFLSFGHGLIMTLKCFDLLEAAGWRFAERLLPGLLFHLVWGIREDGLPPMRELRARLDALAPQLDALRAAAGEPGEVAWDRDAFVAAVLDGGRKGALDAVEEALRSRVAPADVVGGLSLAAAERMLRFDERLARDPGVNEGWLDLTHLQTFANAARQALDRIPDGSALSLLFQSAAFIQREAPLDRPVEERRPDDAQRGDADLSALREALAERDPDRAMACARALLAAGTPPASVREVIEELPLGDRFTRPIVVAHAIKNTRAAFEEHARLGDDPGADRPVLALVRWLATPQEERRIAQLSREASEFVLAARPPRRLTM